MDFCREFTIGVLDVYSVKLILTLIDFSNNLERIGKKAEASAATECAARLSRDFRLNYLPILKKVYFKGKS